MPANAGGLHSTAGVLKTLVLRMIKTIFSQCRRLKVYATIVFCYHLPLAKYRYSQLKMEIGK